MAGRRQRVARRRARGQAPRMMNPAYCAVMHDNGGLWRFAPTARPIRPALYAPRALRAPFAVFFVVFLVLRLTTVLERLAADLLALLPAALPTAFRVGFLLVLLA